MTDRVDEVLEPPPTVRRGRPASGRAALLLVGAAVLPACSAITGTVGERYGARAASATDASLRAAVSAGPTISVAGGLSGERFDGTVALGYFVSGLGSRRRGMPGGYRTSDIPAIAQSDLALVVGAEAGYQPRREAGFVAGHLGAGWSIFSGGLRLNGAFDEDGAGFALGPQVLLHLRLGEGRAQSELQVFAHADLFVAGHDRYPHQVLGGARLLWDLY